MHQQYDAHIWLPRPRALFGRVSGDGELGSADLCAAVGGVRNLGEQTQDRKNHVNIWACLFFRGFPPKWWCSFWFSFKTTSIIYIYIYIHAYVCMYVCVCVCVCALVWG